MGEVDLGRAVEAGAAALWAEAMADNTVLPPDDWADADPEDSGRCRDVTRSVITATLPHIRQALAEEIEAERACDPDYGWGVGYDDGLTRAADIVRGEGGQG